MNDRTPLREAWKTAAGIALLALDEVDRLRAALQAIADEDLPDAEKSHEARVLIDCIRIATAALSPGTDTEKEKSECREP